METFHDIGDVNETRIAAKSCVAELADVLHIDVRKEMCGAFGCVYKQLGTNNVVKIVAGRGAQAELDAAKYLVDLANRGQYHEMLPQIFELWDLGTCAQRRKNPEIAREGAFAVVREDLPDVDWDFDPKKWPEDERDPVWEGMHALLEMEGLLWQVREGFATKDDVDLEVSNYEAEVDWALSELSKKDGKRVLQMGDLFHWGYDNGIVFNDAHMQNWGMRADGTMVLRDLGMSTSVEYNIPLTPEGDVDVRTLSGFVQMHGLHRKTGGTSWRRGRRSPRSGF